MVDEAQPTQNSSEKPLDEEPVDPAIKSDEDAVAVEGEAEADQEAGKECEAEAESERRLSLVSVIGETKEGEQDETGKEEPNHEGVEDEKVVEESLEGESVVVVELTRSELDQTTKEEEEDDHSERISEGSKSVTEQSESTEITEKITSSMSGMLTEEEYTEDELSQSLTIESPDKDVDRGSEAIETEMAATASNMSPPVQYSVSFQVGQDGEEPQEEKKEPIHDRQALITKYLELMAQRKTILKENQEVQQKLAMYFRKKKIDERREFDKHSCDQEQRYVKYMARLEDLQRQNRYEVDTYQSQVNEMKSRCDERREQADIACADLLEEKKQAAMNSIYSRSGRPIGHRDIEQYTCMESKKEMDVMNLRLENIKLKHKIGKEEQLHKSKEELGKGLHLIDFEQLRLENQSLNEKIEERNEELRKLRRKIGKTVEVLTHLKAKLRSVRGGNRGQVASLQEVESLASHKRDVLTRTKQARDFLRIDNHRLRQESGLLGNEPLLRDFEEHREKTGELQNKLHWLQTHHSELALACKKMRKKIEFSRAARG